MITESLVGALAIRCDSLVVARMDSLIAPCADSSLRWLNGGEIDLRMRWWIVRFTGMV